MSDLSRRYAQAFYELAVENGQEEVFFSQLQVVKKALLDEEPIKAFFQWPLISGVEKEKLVKKVILDQGFHKYVQSFILFLIRKNRVLLLEEIIFCYQFYQDAKKGLLRGSLESTKLLTEEEKKEFEEALSGIVKKKVSLSQKQNLQFGGGVLVKLQGRVFNDTILFHLERLNKKLNTKVEQLWN